MFCITLTVLLNSKVEYGRTGHVFLRAVTLSSIREKKNQTFTMFTEFKVHLQARNSK